MALEGLEPITEGLVFEVRHIVELLLHCPLDEVVAEVDLGRRQCPGGGGEAEGAPHAVTRSGGSRSLVRLKATDPGRIQVVSDWPTLRSELRGVRCCALSTELPLRFNIVLDHLGTRSAGVQAQRVRELYFRASVL